jgi:FHS family L-fucose permease-like MFS transporter
MQASVSNRKPAAFTEKKYLITLVFVTSLFMFWGIAITMGDVLNKHFQHVLSLTKTQSAFVQFAIFGAYFVMGIPAGLFMKRFGYKTGVLLGLGLFATRCLSVCTGGQCGFIYLFRTCAVHFRLRSFNA